VHAGLHCQIMTQPNFASPDGTANRTSSSPSRFHSSVPDHFTATIFFLIIIHHALVIHFKKYDEEVHIQICKFLCIISSIDSYMFWPPIVAIFRDILLKDILT
jgi:hypothetical protein